jgi:hypothetical protein
MLLLFLLPLSAFGQRNVYENDMRYQQKKYHFGIHLGANLSNFRIKHSEAFALSDSVLSVRSKYEVGFEIGAIAAYHISRYLELRTVPTFAFANKTLNYTFNDGTRSDIKLSQIYFHFPLEIKFKSQPINDFKIYVIGGFQYGLDLGANLKERKLITQPQISKHDFAINYGFGFELHFPLFILCPEFKVSNSLLNSHRPVDALIYSRMLKGLHGRTFLFSINFEG